MSHRGTVGKTTKSDAIFHNRLVNMVVNRITKDEKNHWLIQFSMSYEKDSTKGKNKSTIGFTSSNM
jgi:hypothetical protein